MSSVSLTEDFPEALIETEIRLVLEFAVKQQGFGVEKVDAIIASYKKMSGKCPSREMIETDEVADIARHVSSHVDMGESVYPTLSSTNGKKIDEYGGTDVSDIIVCQSLCRGWIIRRKKIFYMVKKLVPILEKKIKAYHQMFSLPLIAELWEETLHRSFSEIGIDTTWTPDRSHKVGEDMRIPGIDFSRISCKSGQLITPRESKKNCVQINGGRSTKFGTIEEKLKHFAGNHDDLYCCLAKNKRFDKKYKLLVFPSSLINVNKLSWGDSASGKDYIGKGDFNAIISKCMSSQLWTTIPLELIPYTFNIDCS